MNENKINNLNCKLMTRRLKDCAPNRKRVEAIFLKWAATPSMFVGELLFCNSSQVAQQDQIVHNINNKWPLNKTEDSVWKPFGIFPNTAIGFSPSHRTTTYPSTHFLHTNYRGKSFHPSESQRVGTLTYNTMKRWLIKCHIY